MHISSWRVGLLVAAIALIAFLPCLSNGFVFDDVWTTNEMANYRGLGAAQLKWIFTSFYMGHYQPLTWLSLGLDYAMWGDNPRGYHLTNLLLHAANAWLVYVLAASLISRALSAGQRKRPDVAAAVQVGAVFAALLFALHPLRAESVAWVTDRPDLLSTSFLLLAVWAYVRSRPEGAGRTPPDYEQRRWFVAAVGFYALALLSRGMGIMLPLALLLLDWFPLRRFESDGSAKLVRLGRLIWEKLPFFVLALAAGIIAPLAKSASYATLSLAEHGVAGRLAQACYGLVFYVHKTVVPAGLAPIYELRPPLDVLTPRYLLPIGIVVCGGILLLLGWRRRVPALAAAIACYAILIAPVLGFGQAGQQEVADRYSYWPGIALAVLAGGGLAWLWTRLSATTVRPALRLTWSQAAIGVAGCAAALALAGLSWRQCQVWRTEESLWKYALATGPPAGVTFYNCAVVAGRQGKSAEALSYIEQALQLRPAWTKARSFYGDGLADAQRWAEAAEAYRLTLADWPGSNEVRAKLARTLQRQGRRDEALAEWREILRRDPTHAEARQALQASQSP